MPYLSIRAVETRRADTQIFVDACSTFECCVSDCVIASEAGGVPSTSQLGQGRTIVTRSATGPVQTINHGGSTALPFVWPCHSEAFLDFSLQHSRPAQLHRAAFASIRDSSPWITRICLAIVMKPSYAIPMETSLNARQPVVSDSGTAIGGRPGEQAETELKLLAPQGTLEKLRELPVIVQHARNRGAFRRLETVYYDTPERLLLQHGMSLRVRRSGKHFIQTLKLLPNSGQPLTRRQWEAPVDDVTPDLARLPANEVGDPVTTLTNDARVPVFATRVRRHARQLDLPDASVEIVFDEGRSR